MGPELERAMELIRSAVRVTASISKIEESSQNRCWQEYMERIWRLEYVSDMLTSQLQGKV